MTHLINKLYIIQTQWDGISKSKNLYNDSDIAADIKKRRLEWIGHAVRMDHGRVVKKTFKSKPEGRRMGRPRVK
jgi:hypothetical protein